jgi:3-hydroxyacyl-CoA dehydrogenase
MIDAIKTVGVLGLGVMGFDIAFHYAQKGYRTLVYDASSSAIDGQRRGSGQGPSMITLAMLMSIRIVAARSAELDEAPATVDFIAVEGLKFPSGPLAEIDDLGADSVLKDLQKVNDAMPERKMKAPELLIAMAGEGQTVFKDGRAKPWIAAFVEGRSHARH